MALQFVLAAVVSELQKSDDGTRQRMQDFILKACNTNMLGLQKQGDQAHNSSVMNASHAALSLISSATMF